MSFHYPKHELYDAYNLRQVTVASILGAKSPAGAFNYNLPKLRELYPSGAGIVARLQSKLCPFGCTDRQQNTISVWMGSSGTSQQLHFDWCQNIALHVDVCSIHVCALVHYHSIGYT